MKQRVRIITPYKEFISVDFTDNEDLSDFLGQIGSMKSIKISLIDGGVLYMTQGMMDQAAFILEDI